MGQSATKPFSTNGSVESSTSSGNARGSTPVISRILLAIGSIAFVHALDERSEVRERCDRHIDRLQVAGAVETFEHRAVESEQPLLIDGVETRQPILRAV